LKIEDQELDVLKQFQASIERTRKKLKHIGTDNGVEYIKHFDKY